MTGRILFRTRGGPTHGWGNIFRLGSFAAYCRQRGHPDLVFAVEGPPEVHAWLRDQGFAVVGLPEDVAVEPERALLAAAGPFDCMIMEMLEVTWDRQAMLRTLSPRLVVFDDLCDHAYCADLVVCGQPLPSFANRHLSHPDTRFLMGLDYFLFRPEFLPFAQRARQYTGPARRILVTLGGGRYDVGFLKAAMAIRDAAVPLEAEIILGYANHGRLAGRIREILPGATILRGVSDMEQRLWNTDLAIVSAGYSKLEAAITGTPAAMISVQWHQIPLAEQFAARSHMWNGGYMSYVEPAAIQAWIDAHIDPQARQHTAGQARQTVDGQGFGRVYAAIFSGSQRRGE